MALKNEELIKKLTLEEKCSLLSGKNFWETQEIEYWGIPSVFLSDGPHGLRKQAGDADHMGLNDSIPATCFPTSATSACSWDPEVTRLVGRNIGEEAASAGVSYLLGPGVNMKRDPRCGRNFEYYSEDPYLAGKLASGYIEGVQSNGIAATIKHFAANNQELRRVSSDSIIDERSLREIYLTAFEMAIKESHPGAVMTSYNKLNGLYTNENSHLMLGILRDEWGFEGLVMTDWGGENDRIEGLKCLNALEMPGNGGNTNYEVLKAVQDGLLDENIVDLNVDNLISNITPLAENVAKHSREFDAEAHHEAAIEAARESLVLLKNDKHILPIAPGTKVAIIGEFANNIRYQGAGSSQVNPLRVEQIKGHIHDFGWNVLGYEPGYKRHGGKSKRLLEKAVELAKQADIAVLFLGLDEFSEAEGIDRSHLRLNDNQIELAYALHEAGCKVAVVLECGAPVELPFADEADAIIHAYLSGEGGALAILEALSGRINPSGKLAETYPMKYGDAPTYGRFSEDKPTSEYREGLFIGYRYYLTAGVEVRYPFGHGLSYTEFAYSDLQVTPEGVTFTITNLGKVAGKEVAQLYIGLKNSFIPRPKYELKGFAKVSLEPGESKQVTIPFDEYSFRYFNVKTNRFEVEPGTYDIYIGSSCLDIRLFGELEQQGTEAPNPYEGLGIPNYFLGQAREVSDFEFASLLGHPIPEHDFPFILRKNGKKSRRIPIELTANVSDLRYARGWAGRFLAWTLRVGMKVTGKETRNFIAMGPYNFPVRAISRMTGGSFSSGQGEAFRMIFDGHWHKGWIRFFRESRLKKELRQEMADRLEAAKRAAYEAQGRPLPPKEGEEPKDEGEN